VDRVPCEEALRGLRQGVTIQGYQSRPARVHLLDVEPELPPRYPPIRFRKTVPTAWIEITLHEGRNRQVRRMTAAVGHSTLRLVRIAIGCARAGRVARLDSRRDCLAEAVRPTADSYHDVVNFWPFWGGRKPRDR